MREFARAEFHPERAQVFLEALKPRRPRDRRDEVALREHPGKRDLCGRRVFRARKFLNLCNELHVGMQVLPLKSRDDMAEIIH